MLLSWLLPALFIFLAFSLHAKDFKGVITYKITLEGTSLPEEMKAMMPKTMTLTIKGNMAKMEMITGMGKTVAITNGTDKTSISLIDMMGQKFAVKMTAEEINKEMAKSEGDYKVEITNETKEIVGYTCKKAIIRNIDDGEEAIVFFTTELGTREINFNNPQYKDIDGAMLEFEMPNPEFSMHFIATSVESKNVADAEFEIPAGYQIKTQAELQQMFGGGGN